MPYLVDTNVLLRLTSPKDQFHAPAVSATARLRERGEILFTSSQNLVEAWNAATRPADKNGFGFTPERANRLLTILERGFPRLYESSDSYAYWRTLVVRFGVSGVQAHDARLVALMLVHGLTHILTFNTSDFERYAGLSVAAVSPRDV